MNESSRPVALFDANIATSGMINPRGSPGQVLEAWNQGAYRAISSDDLLAELADVLYRPRIERRFSQVALTRDYLLVTLAA